MLTIWSFSISASLRSGMLTTIRRVTAASIVFAASAAALGFATAAAAAVIARIQFVRFVLMSSSVLRTTRATAQPNRNHLIQLVLGDFRPRELVSAGTQRVRGDTGR